MRSLTLPCVLAAVATVFPIVGRAQSVAVDGSSTVYPISEAIAKRYRLVHPEVTVDVKFSGTTGGFRKLLAGEIHITGASRPIKPKEVGEAASKGLEFIELVVAYDGLSVATSCRNDFVDHLTVEELKRLWEPGSKVVRWSGLRAGWPNAPIRLFGAGRDSGTFDYFTEVICGQSGATRDDYTGSEDDVELVEGVAGDPGALGYFGHAYLKENLGLLRAIPIVGPSGAAVAPSEATIRDGSYAPLSRPLFIYVNVAALTQPRVARFVDFYLAEVPDTLPAVGYVPLSPQVYDRVRQRWAGRRVGSLFSGMSSGIDVRAMLERAASGVSDPQTPTTVEPTPEARQVALDALRDECLRMSRLSLGDAPELEALARQLAQVKDRLDAVARLGSGTSGKGR